MQRSPTIDIAHFEAIDIRVGTIVEAADFPEARVPAHKLAIDFGAAIGVKRSSATDQAGAFGGPRIGLLRR